MPNAVSTRYSKVAIILHWLIAVAIIGQIAFGKWMVGAIKVPETQMQAFQVYQIHKSVGLTILVLSLLRLLWRLMHPAPAFPAVMPGWQKMASHISHWAFYILMIGTPILGWFMVSSSPLGLPTIYFGQFSVPHYPYAPDVDKAAIEAWYKSNHELLANTTLALLIVHVGAALKHHIFDKDTVLWRMLPFTFLKRS
jgi:cytochrome b561